MRVRSTYPQVFLLTLFALLACKLQYDLSLVNSICLYIPFPQTKLLITEIADIILCNLLIHILNTKP